MIITRTGGAFERWGNNPPFLTRSNFFQKFFIDKSWFYNLIINPSFDETSEREFVIQYGDAGLSADEVDLQIDNQGCTNTESAGICVADGFWDDEDHQKPNFIVTGLVVRLKAPTGSEAIQRHSLGGSYTFDAFPPGYDY